MAEGSSSALSPARRDQAGERAAQPPAVPLTPPAPAISASIVSTFEPVVTVVLAAVFLGEHLSATESLGAACVVVAVRLIQSREGRRRRAPEPQTGSGPVPVVISRPPAGRTPPLSRS